MPSCGRPSESAKFCHCAQSKSDSGSMDGVPSVANPNGSNAAASPVPPRKLDPPSPARPSLAPLGPPPPAAPDRLEPPYPSVELPPEMGVEAPSSPMPKLSVGLKLRLSKFESGKANERSGGGLGAGAADADAEAGVAVVSLTSTLEKAGWSVGRAPAGAGVLVLGSGAAAAAAAVSSALSASPAMCVDRRLEAYGEPAVRGLGPVGDPGEADERMRPEGSLIRRSVTK